MFEKCGDLQIFLDPLELNKVIKRKHYPLPTSEEIIPNFIDTKWFSILDLKYGFCYMELDIESSNICTFQTPFRRWKFNGFPFRLNYARKIFQKHNKETFSGILNQQIYFDDLIIYN